MPKYMVNFVATASMTITVEAEDAEAAIEAAHEDAPTGVCAQCSGWGQDFSLDLSGEWELSEYEPVVEVQP